MQKEASSTYSGKDCSQLSLSSSAEPAHIHGTVQAHIHATQALGAAWHLLAWCCAGTIAEVGIYLIECGNVRCPS